MKKQYVIFLAFTLLEACDAGSTSPSTPTSSSVVSSQQTLSITGGTSGLILANTLLTLTSTIVPPTGLQANDTTVSGTNAYVSYNTAGSATVGGIDQINVTIASLPSKTASFAATAADINGVYADGAGNVYAVGADTPNGSLVYSLTATANALTLNQTHYLPGHAGTAVRNWGANSYTLTGDNGGLNFFAAGTFTNTTTVNTSITDARGMDQSGSSNLWVIAGGGNLYEVNSVGTILNTVPFSGANNIAQSKSSVHVSSTAVAASLGSQGAALVCMSDHQVMGSVAQGSVAGADPTLTVSNSVTFGDGLMFVANGLAGVAVYSITNPALVTITGATIGANTACGRVALAYQGVIDFGNAYSANNVYYKNGILYVATGTGGFKVVVVDGTALGLVTGLVSSL